MLIAKIKETIRKYSLLEPGDLVIVAVSGGPDSVCLLAVLQALAHDFNISLHVAHLDHMFRGKESADEALFVAGLAKKHSLPATVKRIDVPALCRERGVSAQAGAREARYGFYSEVADRIGASRIATGHTATDQAETFLMRLIRGAGLAGLSAIPRRRGKIIRPLIDITREEVWEFVRLKGLEYVSDSSNTKPVYTRNRIRMDVLPVLQQINPKIVQTLASEANLLRDENEAAEAWVASAGGLILQEDDLVVVSREAFKSLHPALRRRALKKAVDLAGADASGLSFVQIDEAASFMASAQTGRAMRIACGVVIEREYDRFLVRFETAEEPFEHSIAVPGVTVIHQLGLEVETVMQQMHGQDDSGSVWDAAGEENYFWKAPFNYDKIGPSLTIRNRRPGDWFCPSGMQGKSKKLQDFLVDLKVPRRMRDRQLLLLNGNDILWVVGLRTDERFQPGPDMKNVLLIRIRSISVCG